MHPNQPLYIILQQQHLQITLFGKNNLHTRATQQQYHFPYEFYLPKKQITPKRRRL
jgi:hypothetical protein